MVPNCAECNKQADMPLQAEKVISLACDEHLLEAKKSWEKALDQFPEDRRHEMDEAYKMVKEISDYINLEVTVRGLIIDKLR